MLKIHHHTSAYNLDSKYIKETDLMCGKYVDYAFEYAVGREEYLELGIGHGMTLKNLTAKFKKITVVDADQNLIEAHSKNYPGVTFVHSYFEDYEPPVKFANIGISFVLELVNDPVGILKKYAKHLKENGRIFVVVSNSASLHRLIALNAKLIDDVKILASAHESFGYLRFHTHEEWKKVFVQAGLKITACHGLYLKPFSTDQLYSLKLDNNVYESLSLTARDLPGISNAVFYSLTDG